MLELLKSLVFAICMVPVVMAIILGLIYGLGYVFTCVSAVVNKENRQQHLLHRARHRGPRLYLPP